MKKLLCGLIAYLLLLAAPLYATGTVTISRSSIRVLGEQQRVLITLSWTADAAAATVPATTIDVSLYGIEGFQLVGAETYPGGVAPTNGYTISVTTAAGSEIIGLTGSSTVSVLDNGSSTVPITGDLTFTLSGNAVNSATGTCVLVFSASTVAFGSSDGISGTVTSNQGTAGSAWPVYLSNDPCTSDAKTTLAISQIADTQLVAASAGKKIYVCSVTLVAAAAEVVNFVEGTGTVCATSKAAVVGSTTDANGMSFSANGGFQAGSGIAAVFQTNTAGNALCLTESGTERISGQITYVQKAP